jgi:hypothetical protein
MPIPPRPAGPPQRAPVAPPPQPQHAQQHPQGAHPLDPQTAKLEAHAVPPSWQDPKEPETPPAFAPEPALDPRAKAAPAGAYADGMPIAEEQRARSAWIEREGEAKYMEEIDQRPPEERQPQQVPGVAPPTKRA